MSWISVAPRRWGRTARKPGVAFPGDVLDFGRTTTMMQDSAQNRAPVSPRRPAFRSAASPRQDDAGEGQAHRVRSPLVAPSPAELAEPIERQRITRGSDTLAGLARLLQFEQRVKERLRERRERLDHVVHDLEPDL